MAESVWVGWFGPTQGSSSGSGPTFPNVTVTGQFFGPAADNTAAPPFSFVGDTNTGYASSAADVLALVCGGTTRLFASTTAVTLNGVTLDLGNSTSLSQGAANRIDVASGDSLRLVSGSLQFSSTSRVFLNGTVVTVDDGAGGGRDLNASGTIFPSSGYGLGGGNALMVSTTAPTVSSAGTSPSITGSNGSVTFRANVGTGGTAHTIVITLPAASNGWNCVPQNLTAAAANRADQTMKQLSSTTTSVTLQNQTVSTGAALAFTASDIVSGVCFPF